MRKLGLVNCPHVAKKKLLITFPCVYKPSECIVLNIIEAV